MRICLLVLLIAAAFLSTTGCATVVYEASGNKPVLLSGTIDGASGVSRTQGGGMKLWLIFWLIPAGGPRVEDLQQLALSGEGAQNVRIHERVGFLDMVVSAITGNLLSTLHEEYEADVVTQRRGT